jgi:hypothetical protein
MRIRTLLAISVLTAASMPALPLSCIESGPRAQMSANEKIAARMRESDVVFYGVVRGNSTGPRRVRFEVLRVFRGVVGKEIVVDDDSWGEGPWPLDEPHLIFATRYETGWSMNNDCEFGYGVPVRAGRPDYPSALGRGWKPRGSLAGATKREK